MRFIPAVRFVAVALILLASAIGGLVDVRESAASVTSGLQGATVVTQTIYALMGLLGFFALVCKVRWTIWVLVLWAIAATVTAGLASVAWGGTGLGSGLAAAGGAGLFTALIVWAGWRTVAPGVGSGRGKTSAGGGAEDPAIALDADAAKKERGI